MRSVVVLIFIASIFFACKPKEPEVEEFTNLPYPSMEDIRFYQAEADSGYDDFWYDLKKIASAYIQNSKYSKYKVNAKDFIIRGVGIFIATVEVETEDFILELRYERPFKARGRKSIWQIKSAKEIPWPKKHSISEK